MGFPETWNTVDKEWVVADSGMLGNGLGGSVRELVGWSNDKIFEGEFRFQIVENGSGLLICFSKLWSFFQVWFFFLTDQSFDNQLGAVD